MKIGLIPATIAPYVLRAMGARAAQRYFLTGERFDAAEALRIGFVPRRWSPPTIWTAAVDGLLKHLLHGQPRRRARLQKVGAGRGRARDQRRPDRPQPWKRIADIRASARGPRRACKPSWANASPIGWAPPPPPP